MGDVSDEEGEQEMIREMMRDGMDGAKTPERGFARKESKVIKHGLKTSAKTHGFIGKGPPSRIGTKGYTAQEWLGHFKKVSEEEFAQEQVDYRARFPHMKQWTLQEWIRHNRKWSVKTWAEWTSGVELDAPHSGSLG